jgi:LemA protein
MSPGQWISLAAAAVLMFWMVGAYNRLVALRSTIGSAFGQVDELLQRRQDAVARLVAAARETMPTEQGALDAWLAAAAQVRGAADALRSRPVMAPLAVAMVAAESAIAAAGSRGRALLDQHPEALALPEVADGLAVLREVEPRLVFARQLFNDAAADYNQAARQFPTQLLTRLYGFGTAGRL